MKKVVQFGAGNIGRGFIGLVLEKAGYHVVFADVNQSLIDKLNHDKSYTVHELEIDDKSVENNTTQNKNGSESN